MEDLNEKFKGVWLHKEIFELGKMPGNERIILSMIINLEHKERGCYASNKYFAKILHIQEKQVSKYISKLFDKELITSEILTDQGNKRILRSLLTTSENPTPLKGDTYPVKGGYPTPLKGETSTPKGGNPTPLKGDAYNKVDIEVYKKDEREILPLDFLNSNFSKEFEEWKTKKGNKIFKKEDFREGFNNKIRLEKFKINKDLLMRLEDFTRHWINNQKEDERPYKLRSWNDFEEEILKKQKVRENAFYCLEIKFPSIFNLFNKQGKPKIIDFKKFETDFNNVCLDEQLDFSENILFDRLKTFFKDWPEKYEPDSTSQDDETPITI